MTLHSFFKLAVAAGLVTGGALAQAAATTAVPGGRYGDVKVTQPAGPLHGFVVLYCASERLERGQDQQAPTRCKRPAR